MDGGPQFTGAAGAAKTPKIGDFRSAQKPGIKNHGVLNFGLPHRGPDPSSYSGGLPPGPKTMYDKPCVLTLADGAPSRC